MRVVVQRCSRAQVRIDGTVVGRIGLGFMLLVGITETDTQTSTDLDLKLKEVQVYKLGT